VVKKVVLDGLESIGLRPRQYKKAFVERYLVPRGYGAWRKLIFDEDAFREAVRRAVRRLLEVETADALGDYLEFGVSRGTSMACVHRVVTEFGLDRMRLIGFDSFQGMPPEAAEEGWAPGAYASTVGATRRYLQDNDVDLDRVTLIKGWFSDSLTEATKAQLGLRKASLIMLDCDTYQATREALAFCLPFVRDRAIVIFDDWGSRADIGEIGQREAYQECIEAPGLFTAEPLPGYIPQSRVFLLTRQAAG
jgi:O-methyltransferase